MQDKLKIIKMVLSTILISLLIINILKSCSYAFTYEDFNQFINDTKNIGLTQGQTLKQAYLDTKNIIENNINVENYTTFIILGGTPTASQASSRYYEILCCNNETASQALSSGQYTIRLTNVVGEKIKVYYQTNNYQNTITNINQNNYSCGNNTTGTYGLIENYSGSYNNNNFILQNYYNYFNLLGAENRNTTNLPWYFADARIGQGLYNNEINFQLYDTENNFIKYLNAINKTEVNGGYLYQLEILNTSNIINGEYYRVHYNDNTNDFFISEDFKISWKRETTSDSPTYNASGEITGSIDLTNIENKIENVENAIQNLESGEKERDNFWKQAYNNLFTISGEYIENKINEIKEKYNISGDYETEKQIIELIQENSNDFIISWGDLTTHLSIKGQQLEKQIIFQEDSINFSQLERENKEFQETMQWVRTILGFSLCFLLIENYWKTLLITLGIGTQVYDKLTEEQQKVNTTITIDKKGNQTKTSTKK